MLLIQILEQHVLVPFLTLVLAHVVAPAADRAGEAAGDVGLFADGGDGEEVGADCEDDAAGAGEAVGGC